MLSRVIVIVCIVLSIASLANANTLVTGDLKISGGDLVFPDGSVQSKAQVQGPAGPQGPPGPPGPPAQITLSDICAAIKAANVTLPDFCASYSDIPPQQTPLTVSATVTGSTIVATGVYTSQTQTDLMGMHMTFSYNIGAGDQIVGNCITNSMGSATVAFTVPSFTGPVTVTVRGDTVTAFTTVMMTAPAQ